MLAHGNRCRSGLCRVVAPTTRPAPPDCARSWVGIHHDPDDLVKTLRSLRRSGDISFEVSVVRDIQACCTSAGHHVYRTSACLIPVAPDPCAARSQWCPIPVVPDPCGAQSLSCPIMWCPIPVSLCPSLDPWFLGSRSLLLGVSLFTPEAREYRCPGLPCSRPRPTCFRF